MADTFKESPIKSVQVEALVRGARNQKVIYVGGFGPTVQVTKKCLWYGL